MVQNPEEREGEEITIILYNVKNVTIGDFIC